jgi:post-segregation antitoxin (ccd killing protein)
VIALSEDDKKSNKFRITLPVDLQKKARAKAFDIGMIKNGEGVLSSYVNMLIINDLQTKSPLNINKGSGMHSAETTIVNIRIDLELKERARGRAKELGFIWNDEGNISQYIKYLLSIK